MSMPVDINEMIEKIEQARDLCIEAYQADSLGMHHAAHQKIKQASNKLAAVSPELERIGIDQFRQAQEKRESSNG